MSLLKDLVRPSCADRAWRLYRSRQWIGPKRQFSRSAQSPAPAGSAEAEVQGAHRYCAELLAYGTPPVSLLPATYIHIRRKYDRPSYTLSTFIPRHAQSFYLALRALNVSLSMIPDTTSSYTIGLMRLQYWRDAITKTLSGTAPKEPIAVLLGSAIEDLENRTQAKAQISKGWFMRMISSRERTLTNDPYPDLAAMESYAENTYSTLLYLTLAALPMTSVTADHVASHIGKAAGIAAVLRGLPLVAFPQPASRSTSNANMPTGGAKQGAVMLPLDIMAQSGVKEEEVFRQGAEANGLRDAVFTVATRASDHLITAQQMLANLRAGQDVGHEFEHQGEEGHEYAGLRNEAPLEEVNRAFGVYMPAVGTRLWLDRLQSFDFDIFRPELLRSDWKLPWKAYWAFRRKTF